MTNEELEAQVKDLFESIVNKIKDLGEKHNNQQTFQALLMFVLFNVIDTYSKTSITVIPQDIITHKWTYLAYKISQIAPKNIPLLSTNKQKENITLQDVYEQFKNIDDELKNSDNLIKLAEILKETTND